VAARGIRAGNVVQRGLKGHGKSLSFVKRPQLGQAHGLIVIQDAAGSLTGTAKPHALTTVLAYICYRIHSYLRPFN
jgi:hypothetical protein